MKKFVVAIVSLILMGACAFAVAKLVKKHQPATTVTVEPCVWPNTCIRLAGGPFTTCQWPNTCS